MRLTKRRHGADVTPTKTSLVVTHRPLKKSEFRAQRYREKTLEPINEDESEEESSSEEEEEDEEEERITHTGEIYPSSRGLESAVS